MESPEPNEEEIQKWLDSCDYSALENAVLKGKTGSISKKALLYKEMADFLDSIKKNQEKIGKILEAAKMGDLRNLKSLLDRKKLAYARDNQTGKTVLHVATENQRSKIVEWLVDNFPDGLNIADKQGRTALHFAAAFGEEGHLYHLLKEAGAKDNIPDKFGHKPQHYNKRPEELDEAHRRALQSRGNLSTAMSVFDNDENVPPGRNPPTAEQIKLWVDTGDMEKLEQVVLNGRGNLLIDVHSDSDQIREFLAAVPLYQAKIEAIHKAVEDGDVRRVKSLIDRPKLSTAKDKKGATPMHNAVLYGQTDTLRYLLQRYPETIDAQDFMGRTPLHYAAADRNGGHYIKLLQKAGGDAFIEDMLGHTPFYYRSHPEEMNVKNLKDEAVMEQLISGGMPNSLLQELEENIHDWAQSGNIAKLEELVLNGYGDLLLGRIRDAEDSDVIAFLEILPQYQAKIRAIHQAVRNDNLREVKALTDRKKLALARDGKGATPLHNAILFHHEDVVKYFMKNYPQALNAQDHQKRTPLHYAACLEEDGGKIYRMLRKAGADSNLHDCYNRTPKYYLSYPNHLDLAELRNDNANTFRAVLQQRVAPSFLESSIELWLKEGNIGKLEQLLLSGCGDLIQGRNSNHLESQRFIEQLPDNLSIAEQIHRAVKEGDLKRLKELLSERKRYCLARDRKGCTPLHQAILYGQTEVVRYLVQEFPTTVGAPDYNKRTPVHYAAASRDGGHYYKILIKAGADATLVDNEGRTAEYYLKNQGNLDLDSIKQKDMDSFSVALQQQQLDDDITGDKRKISALSLLSEASTIDTTDGHHSTLNSAILAEDFNDRPDSISGTHDIPIGRVYPQTQAGQYLARTVGPILSKALAEIVIKRPMDPIGYLSDWLFAYAQKTQPSSSTPQNE